MLLTMSDVERGIYDRACDEEQRRQVCCHLQIAAYMQAMEGVGAEQRTLDEVKDAMIKHTNRVNVVMLHSLHFGLVKLVLLKAEVVTNMVHCAAINSSYMLIVGISLHVLLPIRV